MIASPKEVESRTIAQLRYKLFHLLYFLLLSVHQKSCNQLDTGLEDMKYQLQKQHSSAVVDTYQMMP